jgi:hypothetical protein
VRAHHKKSYMGYDWTDVTGCFMMDPALPPLESKVHLDVATEKQGAAIMAQMLAEAQDLA